MHHWTKKNQPGAKMSNEIDQLRVLTSYARVGIGMLQARILSVLSVLALSGLSGFVAYSNSWHGVILCGILALVTLGAFRAESRNRETAKGSE